MAEGVPLMVALRPEKIHFRNDIPSANYERGLVENIAYLGDISIYHVRLESGKLVTATLPNEPFQNGPANLG